MHKTELLDGFFAESQWSISLSAEQFHRARGAISVRELKMGEYLCRKGDNSTVWFGIVDGLIRIENLSKSGKPVNFGTFSTNCWFGEGAILKKEPRKYDAVAVRASTVAFMPAVTFHWLLDRSIPFNRFIITQLNERLGRYLGMIEHARLDDLQARVVHSILEMLHPHLCPNLDCRIEISNEEFGYLVGASRQSINQVLQALEKSGLIKTGYRMITVLDLERLRNFGQSK